VTARYELAAPAERDLEEIFFEVKKRHGRLVAERVFESLRPAFIAYRADVRPIRIVRIARASRDWSGFAPRGRSRRSRW
jgi:hypothetical protein